MKHQDYLIKFKKNFWKRIFKMNKIEKTNKKTLTCSFPVLNQNTNKETFKCKYCGELHEKIKIEIIECPNCKKKHFIPKKGRGTPVYLIIFNDGTYHCMKCNYEWK